MPTSAELDGRSNEMADPLQGKRKTVSPFCLVAEKAPQDAGSEELAHHPGKVVGR